MIVTAGSAAVARLLAAVVAQDDDGAEAVVATLTAADEPALLRLLAHEDEDVQWWALRALGACGTSVAVAPLLTRLANPAPELRSVALMPHLPQLATLLADRDGMVRQVAADTLAQCGDRAIPALVDLLRFSTDQGARSRAAYALGKIRTMAAAPALYRCLNDPNYLVHTYAHEALEQMGLLENMLLLP
jgi:HEAT repeat protein